MQQIFNSTYRMDNLTMEITATHLSTGIIHLPHKPINTGRLLFWSKISFNIGYHFTVYESQIVLMENLKSFLEVGEVINISYEYEYLGY
jgi:hypothetical protein